MKKYLLIILAASFVYVGCDLVDGTNVRNPNLTLEDARGQANSASAWLNGVTARQSILYNNFLTTAELTTDNYVNRATFFNQNVGNGTIRDSDTDIENTNFQIARLREQAKYGVEVVIPENDPNQAGTAVEAELYFYWGWSHLIAGENFVSLPGEPEGPALSPEAHLEEAVRLFGLANGINSDISYDAALARAHYALGNQAEAVNFAQAVLNADPDFVRYTEYDGVNGPTNTFQLAVYDRQSFNDLQPLPRLDFLDPKYGDLGGTNQSPIAILKAEEAYLIIAEAELADGNQAAASLTLLDLHELVESRPVREFNETEEGRIGAAGTIQRPNTSEYVVAASADDPFVEGLVLDRTANTPVPTLSGTSVTEQQLIDLATGSEEDALTTLYLMRQEIFFGEGRRMADLGIRWPVSEVEALNNENITEADRTRFIPSYIPSNYGEMNNFSDSRVVGGEFDDSITTFEVVILHNMNRIIATQRGNKFN